METNGKNSFTALRNRKQKRKWYRPKKREGDMCARRPRAIGVCGGRDDWRGVIAGEETVPGAEDEHRDYPRRFLGPNRGPIPGQIRSLWENAKRSAHITQIPLCFRYIQDVFEVARILLVTDSSTDFGLTFRRIFVAWFNFRDSLNRGKLIKLQKNNRRTYLLINI